MQEMQVRCELKALTFTRCLYKRKLLFTYKDVLPHDVGIGSLSFTRSHNRRSEVEKEEEIANITPSSSCRSEQDVTELDHNDETLVVHNVKHLNINDNSPTVDNFAGVGELKSAAPCSHGDSSTAGVTFNIPVNNSTTLQPSTCLPIATVVGNHGNCTSVFIDVVDWLSPLIIGQLDGKVM